MASVYIESTIPSYLKMKMSRDPIVAGHQRVTQEWWKTSRSNYDACTSEAVLFEIAGGDAALAAERLEAMREIQILPIVARMARIREAELQHPERLMTRDELEAMKRRSSAGNPPASDSHSSK